TRPLYLGKPLFLAVRDPTGSRKIHLRSASDPPGALPATVVDGAIGMVFSAGKSSGPESSTTSQGAGPCSTVVSTLRGYKSVFSKKGRTERAGKTTSPPGQDCKPIEKEIALYLLLDFGFPAGPDLVIEAAESQQSGRYPGEDRSDLDVHRQVGGHGL